MGGYPKLEDFQKDIDTTGNIGKENIVTIHELLTQSAQYLILI